MSALPDIDRSSQWAFDHPKYLPLDGQSAERAMALLLRKGAMLMPELSRSQAQEIVKYMCLEHFKTDSVISFDANNMETGRLMLVLVGEAHIRMRGISAASYAAHSPLQRVQSKWFGVGEGATLGLMHAFAGLSSRFVAQAVTDLFVASLTRETFQIMKKQEPEIALRFMEMTALELALVALDHEKQMVALNQVAQSLQEHINQEAGETFPSSLPSQ